MTLPQVYEIFGITDLYKLPQAIMSVLFGDRIQRDNIYRQLLEVNDYDVFHEWFQPIYEAEMSDRKQKKQDFTPREVGQICSMLVGNHSTIHEPTAGNGGMLVENFAVYSRNKFPWEVFPSEHIFHAWELSERSLPILLLNMSIRGMMGYVYHGDVLERKIIQKYILLNRNNDSFAFSDVVRVDENATIKEVLL